MGKIILERLEFKAYHGLYDEEREKGNHFEVTLTVDTDFSNAMNNDNLGGTVDYEHLYRIVKEHMFRPAKLLEHVAGKIANQVIQEIPSVNHVEVRLSKLNPPIGGPCQVATIVTEASAR